MSTKTKNPDIEDAEIIDDTTSQAPEENLNYSPFDEPVKQRDYTKPNIDTSNLEAELKEPTFEAPQFIDEEALQEEEEAKERAKEPFNPSYNELGNKEKQLGAEMVTEIVLDGYAKIKELAGGMATINETKLEKEFAEGTINPNLAVPIDMHGNTASVREYVSEFNTTTKEACQTSEEFKESVRPVLHRVLKKRGVGMTDEQFLMYKFGTDSIAFGVQVFALQKSAKSVVNAFREQSEQMRGYNTTPPPPSRPATPQKEEEPLSQDEIEVETNYQEPEEIVKEVQPNPIATKKPANSNFQTENQVPDNMPEFGDPKILNEIEKIAKKESQNKSVNKPKRGRGRPKKSK